MSAHKKNVLAFSNNRHAELFFSSPINIHETALNGMWMNQNVS